MTRNLTCKGCGQAITTWTGNGRPPRWCANCQPRPDRALKAAQKRLAAADTERTIAAAQPIVNPAQTPIAQSWRSRILAIGLGLDSDPARAAGLVGLTLSPSELEAVARQAAKHADLTDAKPGAVGRVMLAALALGSVRLCAQWDAIPIAQQPNAQRALAHAIELIQGSTQPTYTDLRLVVEAPDGHTLWTDDSASPAELCRRTSS